MRRIVIIEPNHSHEEVLYPWIELLHSHYEVYVVAPKTLLNIDLLKETSALYHAVPYIDALPKTRISRFLGTFKKYAAITKTVDQIDPALVLFNSVPTLLDAALMAWNFGKRIKIQVIHNFQNYLLPGARFLYRAFDGNLVISEQVFHYIKSHHPGYGKLDYVLPIFFDGFRHTSGAHVKTAGAGVGGLKVGVFGTIEPGRRNYRGLLNDVARIVKGADQPRFQIYLVGKAPRWLQEEVREHHLENVVVCNSEFFTFRKMFELLDEMDLVLYLIDDSVQNARHYNRYKITGTSTLVKAFNKVGCASTDFPMDDSLMNRCFFYKGTDVKDLLDKIDNGHITRNDVLSKIKDCGETQEFSFQKQQARLFAMIERVMAKT